MLHLRRLQNSIRCTPQSLLAGLLVFLLFAASGAIPLTKVVVLPVNRLSHAEQARLADARPFPCQSHRCGCHSAEGCGKKCCCFSPAQVADWYAQHADELAAYDAAHGLNALHTAEWHTAELLAVDSQTPDSESNRSPPRRNCCTVHTDVLKDAVPDEASDDASAGVEGDHDAQLVTIPIAIDAVRRCQGLSTLWLLLAQALPADSTPLWQFEESATATVDVYVAICPNVVDRPDIPPPRA